jgi:predicted dinucleotide-binding enzyme
MGTPAIDQVTTPSDLLFVTFNGTAMHLSIIGDGRLVMPLTELAARAGHTVLLIGERSIDANSCALSDLVIVTGERAMLADLIVRVGSGMRADVVVVDATTGVGAEFGDGSDEIISENEWMALLPSSRIVRAFASVPPEAFVAIVDQSTPRERSDLAVPLAGDDADAKATVCELMRQIGVEPFDLGSSRVSYVMEPAGPLWGKAVSDVDMRELIGWLSGDG